MNPKERVLSVLSDQTPDKIPVTCVTQVGVVEAMEKLGCPWPEAHSDPVKMAKLGASLYELAGLETARIPFDLTAEAEALGCQINIGKMNRQPSIITEAFHSLSELNMPPEYVEKGRIPVILKAIEILKNEHPELPIMVGITGPFTLAGHLFEIGKLVKQMKLKPTDVEDTLDNIVDGMIFYTDKIAEAGADIIVVNDPSAAPELIDPMSFKASIRPRLKYLASNIKIKKVLHICGATIPIIADMADCDFDAISIEDKADMLTAKGLVKSAGNKFMPGRPVGPKKAVKIVGNVSTAKTIFMGTPDQVKEEAKKALTSGTDLLAPACGIAPGSPLANIKALVEARDEYCK
jgi:[methyl-Co(III) methanol-specific corrinoid protein]:coenzyme M methyltransferase